jgi:hypothetical protein
MSQKRSLLTNGLALTLRHWPAFVWTYLFNLGLALLFAIPLYRQLAEITEHSFASQALGSGFDIGTLTSVFTELGKGPGPAINFYAVWIYIPLYFILVPGTLFCYQTGASANLRTLLESGLSFFWRFVRITLISFLIFGVIIGPLMAFYNHYSNHLEETTLGRPGFHHRIIALVIIGLIAAALRVYFDLVEGYTIQLGQQIRPATAKHPARPDRRVRYALKPAFRALRHNFLRTWLTFVFLTALGLSAVIITAHIDMHSLAQPQVIGMFLLAQLGLALMLFTRFWQRGAETVLALDNPIPEPVIILVPPTPEPIIDPVLDPIPEPQPIEEADVLVLPEEPIPPTE